VLILKVVKVLCFDTLLQVLILKGVTGGILIHFLQVLILNNLAENGWDAEKTGMTTMDGNCAELPEV